MKEKGFNNYVYKFPVFIIIFILLNWINIESGEAALKTSQILQVKYLFNPVWSPEGDKIAFIWDEGGIKDIWVVSISDKKIKKISESKGNIGLPVWSKDGSLFFIQEGSLYFWNVSLEKPVVLKNLGNRIFDFDPSPKEKTIVFSKDGDLWLHSFEKNINSRLTSTCELEFSPKFSPTGDRVVFTSTPSPEQIQQIYPDLAGPKIAFLSTKYPTSDVGVISIDGGEVVWVKKSEEDELNPRWSPDGRMLAVERRTKDCRKREIWVRTISEREDRMIYEESTDKWIYELSNESYWSPKGDALAFISDKDGWYHLYTLTINGKNLSQLTRGEYEVSYPAWSPDGKMIAFTSNEGSLIERNIWIKHVPDGKIEKVTFMAGTNMMPLWSPRGEKIAFLHSSPYSVLDLWVLNVLDRKAIQLTSGMPESIRKEDLIPPEFFYYQSKDGLEIPAFLFKPINFDEKKKYPAVIWVHGDGILQNRLGWHPSKNYGVYYGFHQYLLHKDYVALSLDYRGSIGYGRDFMHGHYKDLGEKDCDDVIAGAEYLQTLDFIDPESIGVWGLSYGGYLTLQAIIRRPDLFKAAINVAGVTDWLDWYNDPGGWWIQGRMGTPDENRELYHKSSPINFVEKIATPLLILHGTADFNVPFYESIRLIDSLVKKNKKFELMIYPGEDHYFIWNSTWEDVFQRVENFFDRHLKKRKYKFLDNEK